MSRVVKYEAKDGSLFSEERDCDAYELSLEIVEKVVNSEDGEFITTSYDFIKLIIENQECREFIIKTLMELGGNYDIEPCATGGR